MFCVSTKQMPCITRIPSLNHMHTILLIFSSLLFASCSADVGTVRQKIQQAPAADSLPPHTNPAGKTVEARFPAPEGFVRLPADPTSFAAFLRRLSLYPEGRDVHLFDGRLKNWQDLHCAVLDLDVGKRDLQQCADAVIRLRAEYLYAQRRYADIHFNFTNGFRAEYARWRRGDRIRVNGNRASWIPGNAPSESYSAFRQYLDQVFMYAGTASLARELVRVTPEKLQPGDVWIRGGHPGHAVIVLDVVEKPETGERRFLLAQSYMPAQDIHVLRNPAGASPWYTVPGATEALQTPEWVFDRDELRRFD